MTTYINNLLSVNWQSLSASTLKQQCAYMHIVPANFASDRERTG
jgi:hypothetical protein